MDDTFDFFMVTLYPGILGTALALSLIAGPRVFVNISGSILETVLLFLCKFRKDLLTWEFVRNLLKPYIGLNFIPSLTNGDSIELNRAEDFHIGSARNFLSTAIIPYGLMLMTYLTILFFRLCTKINNYMTGKVHPSANTKEIEGSKVSNPDQLGKLS